jgi:uncharacterized integral membrane protein
VRFRKSERGLYTLIAITALLVIYGVAFVVSNSGRVEVSFVIFSGRAPLILVMTVSALVGLAVGLFANRLAARLRAGKEPPADPPI